MEKVKIEDLISGKSDISSIQIVRTYVPISEKIMFGRQIAEAANSDNEFDLIKFMFLQMATILVSYTNMDIQMATEDLYDFVSQHDEIYALLPSDAAIYEETIVSCLEEYRKNDAMEKTVKENVVRTTAYVNRLLKSVASTIEKIDVEKTGFGIEKVLTIVAQKLPDLKNEKVLRYLTEFLKSLKG